LSVYAKVAKFARDMNEYLKNGGSVDPELKAAGILAQMGSENSSYSDVAF